MPNSVVGVWVICVVETKKRMCGTAENEAAECDTAVGEAAEHEAAECGTAEDKAAEHEAARGGTGHVGQTAGVPQDRV